MEYIEFVESKLRRVPSAGLTEQPELHASLFDFQRDIVAWALRRGRAAIFASTGLGKTRMQLEWAKHVPGPVLILAPLAVAAQTANEAATIAARVKHCKEQCDFDPDQITITNYDRLHKFDASLFNAIVLDESSIIKHHDAKTLTRLMESFESTPYRLCCTATPSPNDYTELGTHAEFLGVCTRAEMLAEFFVHDGGETQSWRLKGHARSAFWKWVAEWAALVRSPADLGYDGSSFKLPDLAVNHHVVASDVTTERAAGLLFPLEAKTLSERRNARKASVGERVRMCADMVNGNNEPWVVWCDLNAESEALTKSINGAVEVRGSDDIDTKEARLAAFANGTARVLVSKPSICGFGLNWQHARNMAFVGVTDSWEAYHQAVRREWRFGQKRPVLVHIFTSDLEGKVVANLERKEAAAAQMADELSRETFEAVKSAIHGATRTTTEYTANTQMTLPDWLEEEVA